MAATDSPGIEARAADRVVVFSDAVVAIAITLLALELPSPNAGANASNLDVPRSLGTTGPPTSPFSSASW